MLTFYDYNDSYLVQLYKAMNNIKINMLLEGKIISNINKIRKVINSCNGNTWHLAQSFGDNLINTRYEKFKYASFKSFSEIDLIIKDISSCYE
jgi:hypothetical protein